MTALLSARNAVLALSVASALAMLYVGAYQIRAVEHLSCPLFKGGCEAVADAPFARPFGIPDGFLAVGMYAVLIVLAFLDPNVGWVRYSIRTLAILAALANGLGVYDMTRLGAFCFYCLITTVMAPFLVWAAFRM
jgi:uncharacterized membrane protein